MAEQGIKDRETWTDGRDARQPKQHSLLKRLSGSVGLRGVKQTVKDAAKRTLPAAAQRRLYRWWRGNEAVPPVGQVDWGGLRRLTPINRNWGFERGQPVDRHYIERFLAEHAADVRGRVLEIADATYTRRFGGQRVTHSDVLHAVAGNPAATIVGDLARGEKIPSDSFDCIICTQTLLVIYDVHAAVRTLHRILKPGGVLLVTIPGGCHQVTSWDMEHWGDYWRFTRLSARRLFEEVFPPANVAIESHGNVLAAIAFLHGVTAGELRLEELDYRDPEYEVSITVRAVKEGGVL